MSSEEATTATVTSTDETDNNSQEEDQVSESLQSKTTKEKVATVKVVAGSLKTAFAEAGGFFSVPELAFGIRAMRNDYENKILQSLKKKAPKVKYPKLKTCEKWIYWCRWTQASYRKNLKEALEMIQNVEPTMTEEHFIKCRWESQTFKPAYFVAKHPTESAVVVGIRGTASISDALTDISAGLNPFPHMEGQKVHDGMDKSALWFVENIKPIVEEQLKTVKKCYVCGHSLGAGTATLFSLYLNHFFPKKIECFAFATPSVATEKLARSSQDYITTFVLNDDIVPRISTTAIRTLRHDMMAFDWATITKNDLSEAFQTNLDKFHSTPQGAAIHAYAVAVAKSDAAKKIGSAAMVVGAHAHSAGKKIGKGGMKAGAFLKRRAKKRAGQLKALTSKGDEEEEESASEEEIEIPENPSPVLHDLFPPGTIVKIHRHYWNPEDATKLDNASYKFGIVDEPPSHFLKIILSSQMVADHSLGNYFGALQSMIKELNR